MGKEKIVGLCALCDKQMELKQSHILSKFLFRIIKETGSFVALEFSNNELKGRPIQDGTWEHLLCGECEAKRQKYETYVSNLIRRKALFDYKSEYTIKNLDYKNFKLYEMSNLFMFVTSNRKEYKDIKIPEYYDDLKDMVLQEDPGDSIEFGCRVSVVNDNCNLFGEKNQLRQYTEFIVPPIILKTRLNTFIICVFGGYMWTYVLTRIGIAPDLKRRFISEKGSLRIDTKKTKNILEIYGFKVPKNYHKHLEQNNKNEKY